MSIAQDHPYRGQPTEVNIFESNKIVRLSINFDIAIARPSNTSSSNMINKHERITATVSTINTNTSCHTLRVHLESKDSEYLDAKKGQASMHKTLLKNWKEVLDKTVEKR